MNSLSAQCQKPLPLEAEQPSSKVWALWKNTESVMKEWSRRYQVRAKLRAELMAMDSQRIESDVGLSPGELRREATKPFWKA